jgi:hypothetical protein
MTTELKNMLFFAEEVSNLVFDAEGMIVKHRDACMQAFLSPHKYQHEVQVCNVWIQTLAMASFLVPASLNPFDWKS